jgi:hypothetical protein
VVLGFVLKYTPKMDWDMGTSVSDCSPWTIIHNPKKSDNISHSHHWGLCRIRY